jgi:hypothetical protein
MDEANPNFEKCVKCVSSGICEKETVATLDQPRSYNGRDYVANPLSNGTFSRIAGRLTRGVPHILKKGLPLEHLIAQHGAHLQYLLANRVTWQDFLDNGYTWKDVQVYSDIASRDDRTRQALVALQVNASHFNDSIPIADIQSCVDPRAIVEHFGLYFSETGAPLTAFNKEWTLQDLADLNFTVDDLFGAGLENVEQYEYLQPTPELERRMGITATDIDELPSIRQSISKPIPVESQYDVPVEPRVVYVEKPVYLPVAHKPQPPLRYRQPLRFHGLKN